jgi:hypothetical protein
MYIRSLAKICTKIWVRTVSACTVLQKFTIGHRFVIWLKPKRKTKKKEGSLGAHSRLRVFGFYNSIVVDVEAADVGRVRQGSKEVQLGVAKYLRRSASPGEVEHRPEQRLQRRRAPCCPGCSERRRNRRRSCGRRQTSVTKFGLPRARTEVVLRGEMWWRSRGSRGSLI